MLAEHKRLEKEISDLQSKLKSFPDGKLFCVHNGNHYKWFHSDGHTKTYIPKKHKEYAEKQLDLVYDDFMKYIEYMTEKYYRNGFVDGVQLIKGCCDSSRPF